MKRLIQGIALTVLFVHAAGGCRASEPEPTSTANESADPETRIVRYLESHVKPGQQVIVSDLYQKVFTAADERKAIDRMFNAFFKIPLAVVDYQTSAGRIPTLEELSGQFGFTVPGEVNVLLKIMESDPRVPKFFKRDPGTGEITWVDTESIRSDPQFGRRLDRSVAGWEGKRAPGFSIRSFSGDTLSAGDVSAGPYVIYFWFTDCPPCVKTAPLLVELEAKYRARGFRILAVNADQVLELPFTDDYRAAYLKKAQIQFPNGHLTADMQRSFGGITLYPTFFFVDSDGFVVKHLMNFQEKPVLEAAIRTALGEKQ